jgi:hypothetical protein
VSGSEAILVLQRAREIAGRGDFRGSRGEALRLAAIDLDADHTDALVLLQQVVPPERLMEKLANQVPRVAYSFRQRMLEDFDNAVAKLAYGVKSRRARIGRLAADEATNWSADARGEAGKDRRWGEIFEKAAEAAKKVILQ